MVGKLERPGVHGVGFAGFHDLAEDGLDLGAGIERKMILADKEFRWMAADVGIGLVHPDEIEVTIEVGDMELGVLEYPLQHLARTA